MSEVVLLVSNNKSKMFFKEMYFISMDKNRIIFSDLPSPGWGSEPPFHFNRDMSLHRVFYNLQTQLTAGFRHCTKEINL